MPLRCHTFCRSKFDGFCLPYGALENTTIAAYDETCTHTVSRENIDSQPEQCPRLYLQKNSIPAKFPKKEITQDFATSMRLARRCRYATGRNMTLLV